MNFKAHMTLLSWRELMLWMDKRGQEATKLLEARCLELADTRHNWIDGLSWDRAFAPETDGTMDVRIVAYDAMGRELEFCFETDESDWFSYKELTLEMFRE